MDVLLRLLEDEIGPRHQLLHVAGLGQLRRQVVLDM